MPDVKILIPAGRTENTNVMTMTVEGEPTPVSFYTTPPQINGSFGTWRISEAERPGRNPATFAAAPGNRTVTFEHKVWAINPYEPIRSLLTPFRVAAEKGKRIKFTGGGVIIDGSWWWPKTVDLVEDAKARNNEPSRVTLTWTLAQASLVSKVELTKSEVKVDNTPPTNRPHLLFDSAGNRAPARPQTPPRTAAPTTPAGNTTDPNMPMIPGR